jgi:hypothetical protein
MALIVTASVIAAAAGALGPSNPTPVALPAEPAPPAADTTTSSDEEFAQIMQEVGATQATADSGSCCTSNCLNGCCITCVEGFTAVCRCPMGNMGMCMCR